MLRSGPRAAALALACAAITLVLATAARADLGPVSLVSQPAGFGTPDAPSVNDSGTTSATQGASLAGAIGLAVPHLVSSDNRFVAFVSSADGLSTEDDDAVQNVYVRDTTTQTTTLVSRATGVAGAGGDGDSFAPALSSNGRYVAFASMATNLSGADTNGTEQIYVRDLAAHTTTLVSRADGPSGQVADQDALQPAVDDDGDVVFSSSASNLVAGAPAGVAQVYLRRGTDTYTMSRRHDGISSPNQLGDGDSFAPAISADGSRVAFTSRATNLTGLPGDDLKPNVMIRTPNPANPDDGATTIADRAGAQIGNNAAGAASLNADGSRVVFLSSSTNLDPADTTDDIDVYVRQLSGANFVVLASPGTTDDVSDPSIDATGVRVAFTSDQALVAQDTNGLPDVYRHALGDAPVGEANGTLLVSRNAAGPGTLASFDGSIAPDGEHVAFTTFGRGFTADGDDDFSRVYLRRLTFGLPNTDLALISRPDGTGAFASHVNSSLMIGAGGRAPAYVPQAVSTDGRYVVFSSDSDDISPDDDNRYANVFERDTLTGAVTLVSRADGPAGAPGDGDSGLRQAGGSAVPFAPPAVTPDGRYVVFVSRADNLVPGDANGAADVFVRDVVAGTTTLVSRDANGQPGTDDATGGTISADGRRVAFVTASKLVPADNDALSDVYVRDLATGTTILASRKSGVAGAKATAQSGPPAISADGHRVAFNTKADLTTAPQSDGNGQDDVYVRDLDAATTTLASARTGQDAAGNGASFAPSLSADGSRVAFTSLATDLAAPNANGTAADVFVRDLGTKATSLASRATGASGAGGNAATASPSLSADGTRVAMRTTSSNLAAGAPAGGIVVRDLAAQTTTLVAADGLGGPADTRLGTPFLSPDGRCVAFDARSQDIAAGLPAGTDFPRVFMRGDAGACPTPPASPGGGGGGGGTPGAGGGPGGGGAPGGGPGVEAADTTPPALTGVSLSRSRFRVGAAATAVSARATPAGTTIRLTLSEPATVTFTVQRPSAGRRSHGRCVKATAKLRRARRCTRYAAAGTFRRALGAGRASVAFSGRIGRRALAPGRYRLSLVAADAAGNRSAPRTATFTIVRR